MRYGDVTEQRGFTLSRRWRSNGARPISKK